MTSHTVHPFRILLALFGAALLALHLVPARAADNESSKDQDANNAIMLVAKPDLKDPFYASTVLIVRPLQNGGHAGFVLNKPTNVTLGQAFPEDEPSQKVRDPVYLGGPVNANVIFALVKQEQSPGEGAMEFAKGLFLALAGETVDRVIREEPDRARFFAGAVLWRPGELDQELKLGAWYVMDADSDLAISGDADHLWDKLVQRSQSHDHSL